MELLAVVHARDHEPVDTVQLLANGTLITIAERTGGAIQVLVTGTDGSRIVDVTIRHGPSGAEREDE